MSQLPSDTSQLSALQQSLFVVQKLKSKLTEIENAKTEPIAIIGMSCRFPGGANDPERFWQLLHEGADTISEVPAQRWNINDYYDPNPDALGKMYTRTAGFLNEVDQFDPLFFGISPREAVSLDPQQRLLLEVSWEALENAAQPSNQLSSSQTGIFVGIGQNDYAQLQIKLGDPTRIDAYTGTGNGFCFASGRLSYVLGLQGPNMAIDTACSSSLVAVHLACQSLRAGECNLALAGGVQLILSPETTIFLSKARALSPDGRCKTFDAAADGFGRGEGCGVVVLKRLSDAIANKDNILAVIRGSAINHDGPSSGLTVPNGLAQQKLILKALENAKVEPSQVSYVETHGTGTALGDPIEVESLGAIFGKGRQDNPLIIGSVKTNIGHLEPAAGVAGLMKVVLSFQHNEIPPHPHFKQPNPYINWDELPVVVPTSSIPWFSGEKRRLAGVSSFGMGGTNAHIVLEEPPILETVRAEVERPVHLLTLSAKTEVALKQLALRYNNYLAVNPSADIGDICYTANAGRTHFPHRLSVVASSGAQLREKLANFSAGQTTAEVFQGQSNSLPKIAFLFTGQGSQYVGMGRQLYETAPVFRTAINCCNEILRPYLEKPLLSVLYPEPGQTSPINQTAYTQPALFAIEYALVQLWQSWGIHPDAVMGHSVGEYVAATVAGVLSLEDGLKLIANRSRLMQTLPPGGEMVAVFSDEAYISKFIDIYTRKVSFAAFNGDSNTVISGDTQAIQAICADLQAAGISTKKLQTSHAFHSPLMEPILAEFREVAEQVTYGAPQLTIISNLTGERLTPQEISSDYWCLHLRCPVQFGKSLKALHAEGYEVFVEIGPKPTLLGMGRNCLPDKIGAWLPSLRPGQEDWRVLLQSLGELYVRGAEVDWSGFDRGYERRRVMLPTYPFQRQRYWVQKAESEHQQTELSSQQTIQTSIVNLLQQGNIAQLTKQLETAGKFSQEQMKILPQMLEVLVKQHQQEIQTTAIKDWLYEIEWQQMPQQTVQQNTQRQAPGTWVVFADASGVGQALGELLQQHGQSCILVYNGKAYQNLKPGIWSINPTSPKDFERLFQEVLRAELPPLKGIVHLWSLEAMPPNALTIPTLESAQNLGCLNVLHLVQTLSQYNELASCQLWLVTRGAIPVKGDVTLAVAQAPLWGLGKVIALEYPELWGGMFDLAPESTGDEATQLLAEIENSLGEDHIAFRERKRYVPRLILKEISKFKQVELSSDSTYLITGGLGALGLRVARWMVSQGARQLVLVGRSAASDAVQSTLRQLEQLGAKVFVAQADVSDEADVVKLLATMNASMPPLRGIVHAAGVSGYKPIKDMDSDTFESVVRPKVLGTWILHQLTQDMKLDFFVNFSSIASVWGSKGQAHYAAANHFLDVLAHHRQGLGLPGLTVNWGPWADGGMVVEEFQRWMSRMGVSGLQPENAIAALEYLMAEGSVQTTVANIDWSLFKEVYEARGKRPLLELLAGQSQKGQQQPSVRHSDILPRLLQAQSDERLHLLVVYLQEQITKVLGFDESLVLNPHQSLLELGLDSLMAVQLKNAIATDLEVNAPVEKIIDGSSIMQLAELLLQELAIANTTPPAPPSSLENELELIKLPIEDGSTSFASLASATKLSQDNWIEGEL
ncbi:MULTISPECIES: type I polyketide synthase [Scytonema]|uniref:SDR family NAD(P)-dependent oxidoreductase n=1 Tax=Scytonema tolypothrichoides VB-61278_2 TaxID=3232314 RepID=A0ABW8WNN4_9CYAN